MRTASDGRGDEPQEDPITTPSADDEATRVFSRDGYAGAASATDTTREFTRGAVHSGDQAPSGDGGAAEATREFTRSDQEPAPAAFTRRFVRDRPLPRTRGERPLHRDGADGPATEEPHPPEPGTEDPRLSEPDNGARPPRGPRRSGRRPQARPHKPKRRRRRRFRLRWILALALVAALAVPPATWGWVWYTARQDERGATDAIVVLGASQYNGVPSPVFEARLRQAQVLYLDGVAPFIVTVGGKLPDDAYTEAASGRNWLVEVGVPADQVIAVEEGSDTLQSFQAVSEVFEANGWETATLVSDPWHSLRSRIMAADHGIEAGTSPARSGPAVIERRTQLWYITRETASLWYYWIFNDSSDIRVNAA
ncbi:hypothetical protein GCM10007079_34910 [Nocardiopsis terrae]|uniref:Uncharacterized SAM-binding protein YcdF (DUF218 family) n=1 Tax=Nocardiopsis terrae TaxID=372655 RepID=A0ABR9HJV9_9ACTN|nr:YdcF family protein [Nocardiopsis terrae]MBE1459303.1 uncharacterized SAM-binding protein YcdF (DUF218 family) [Nocardiopsis terrae]GHC89164.1 hypothetical protein GCM10007079_34910 [Nocardiopsis terrae]